MTDLSKIYLTVLAAGSSRRFGSGDKLSADLRGKMLGHHVADRVGQLGWGWRSVITRSENHACENGWGQKGYHIIDNPFAHKGIGTSLALAAAQARKSGAEALIIMLADMPFVSLDHISKVVGAAGDLPQSLIASNCDGQIMPPALFGSRYFGQLVQLNGDIGARGLLKEALQIATTTDELADIDTPYELARFNRG